MKNSKLKKKKRTAVIGFDEFKSLSHTVNCGCWALKGTHVPWKHRGMNPGAVEGAGGGAGVRLCLHLLCNWVSLSLILSWFREQASYSFTDKISLVGPRYRKACCCLSHTEPTQQDARGTDTALLDAWARAQAQPGLGFPIANWGASSSVPVASWVIDKLQAGPRE